MRPTLWYCSYIQYLATPFVLTAYAELHCLSNFSFLRGASHPEELVERAHALGYAALAITDEASLAGVVRAHQAAKRVVLPLLIDSPTPALTATRACTPGSPSAASLRAGAPCTA